ESSTGCAASGRGGGRRQVGSSVRGWSVRLERRAGVRRRCCRGGGAVRTRARRVRRRSARAARGKRPRGRRAAARPRRPRPGLARRETRRGGRTEGALGALRARARWQAIDTIVAAALVQRRSGGDLARLLRDTARALEDQERLVRDARTATAQARFTGLIVVLLPLGGALLAELASPGYLRSLAGSFLTAWVAGLAVVMQVIAAVLIRRLGRVRM